MQRCGFSSPAVLCYKPYVRLMEECTVQVESSTENA